MKGLKVVGGRHGNMLWGNNGAVIGKPKKKKKKFAMGR